MPNLLIIVVLFSRTWSHPFSPFSPFRLRSLFDESGSRAMTPSINFYTLYRQLLVCFVRQRQHWPTCERVIAIVTMVAVGLWYSLAVAICDAMLGSTTAIKEREKDVLVWLRTKGSRWPSLHLFWCEMKRGEQSIRQLRHKFEIALAFYNNGDWIAVNSHNVMIMNSYF